MKKLYTLIFLFMLFGNLKAQTIIDLPSGGDLSATVTGLTAGDYVINLPAGASYIGAGLTITVPLNVNLTISGPDVGTKPIIQYKVFDVTDNTTTAFTFKNVELVCGTGTSDQYLFNFPTGRICTMTKIELKNCIVRDYLRSVIRTQATPAKITEIIVDNCVVKNIGIQSGQNYQFIAGSSEIKKITLKNSTFSNIVKGFIDLKNVGCDQIDISDCTFNNNIVDSRSLINLQSSITKTVLALNVTNTIFGSSKQKANNVKAINNSRELAEGTITNETRYVITQTVTNSYKTSDWIVLTGVGAPTTLGAAWYDFSNLTAYSGTSNDLFADTTARNFSFKDLTFAGVNTAGDPRWRPVGDTDASLSALTLSAGTLNPIFASATESYTVFMPKGTTTVPTVSATTTDANATKVITQATNLTGTLTERTATVEVTAKNGSTKKTYTIVFSIEKSTDATLSALSVSAGTLNPAFAAATVAYTVTMPRGTTLVPTVSATTTDANATKVITQATNLTGTSGERTATVVVTAEDGTTPKTYTIVFSVEKNNDATLSALSVSAGTLNPAFASATVAYTVTMPRGTTAVPTVSATTTDANATKVITQATNLTGTSGERTATVVVTAEDGTTPKTYTIVFSVEKNNDATLSALSVSVGTLNPAFASATLAYTVALPQGTTAVPTVSATTTDANATKVITQATNLTGTLAERTANVVVTAEDGTTPKTYTIVFTVLTGVDENTLENIVNLYPNPTSRIINLDLQVSFTIMPEVMITNSIGQIVLKQRLDNATSKISVETLSKGIYHVTLISKGKISWSGSFIKVD